MKLSFESISSGFFFINAIVAIAIIILERRRPEKTIAWLIICVVLPPVGLFLYLFVGRNWKKHKLNDEFSPVVKELIWRVLDKIDNDDFIPLIQLLASNSDSPLFIDNSIKVYNDGNDKFESLCNELKKAKHHIHLEYYIVKSDNIGNRIKDILIEKAKQGVKVRFIMDKVGSIRVKRKYLKELKAAGVEVIHYSYFLAPLLRHINTQINYRNHRKIVIIDGRVGFVGGMNIGDEYLGNGKLGYWRDMHLMVKGDFVLGLQATFLDDYMSIKKANREAFEYEYEEQFKRYFPPIAKSSGKIMQLVKSGPNSEYPSIMHAILKMITMAKEHIFITTPYFVPPESIMEALKVAALGGINIKILFPGKYDHLTVYYASRTYLAELAKCGVEIYFYNKNNFIHSKFITIDSKIATVGTANIDIRSFELNYEINAVIYDNQVTKEIEDMFYEDLNNSEKLSPDYFENSSKFIKFVEAVARLFSELL